MNVLQIKRLVPKVVKRPIKKALLRRQLSRAIKKIADLNGGQIPSRDLLASLIEGWSNEGFVANLDYLEEVARRTIETRGNILECGSGVTTILMGVLCAKTKKQVWSLENSADWQERIVRVLETNGILHTNVCYSPLIEYGEFCWYDSRQANMPKEFSLIICDGPPGSTRGGRFGLLPVMRPCLNSGTTILLDDAGRPGEIELIKRWEQEVKFDTNIIDRSGHIFAVMHLL
jgi:hypothetical protein